MDKRSIEPLHVVAVREAVQHLIGQDRNGQQENSAHGDRQRERAQPQPAGREAAGEVTWVGVEQQNLGERLGLSGMRQQCQRVQAKGRVTRPCPVQNQHWPRRRHKAAAC